LYGERDDRQTHAHTLTFFPRPWRPCSRADTIDNRNSAGSSGGDVTLWAVVAAGFVGRGCYAKSWLGGCRSSAASHDEMEIRTAHAHAYDFYYNIIGASYLSLFIRPNNVQRSHRTRRARQLRGTPRGSIHDQSASEINRPSTVSRSCTQ